MDIFKRGLRGYKQNLFTSCLLFVIELPIVASARPFSQKMTDFNRHNAPCKIFSPTTTFDSSPSQKNYPKPFPISSETYKSSLVSTIPTNTKTTKTNSKALTPPAITQPSIENRNIYKNVKPMLARGTLLQDTSNQLRDSSQTNKTKYHIRANAAVNPPIIINEFLANPPPLNEDDKRRDIEFIELVNGRSAKTDISGWSLYDTSGVCHIFPAGTILNAKQAIVVFGSGSPTGSFGGAVIQTASTGSLNLGNDGDEIILKDKKGTVIQKLSYGSEGYVPVESGESTTRDEDITGNFTLYTHSKNAIPGTRSTPGKKIDGTSFGPGYTTAIRGHEGWRFIAAPTQKTTFKDLLSNLWTQGIPNSDAPSVASKYANIRSWNERDRTFQAIGGMNQKMVPGKGYVIYVYNNNDEIKTAGKGSKFPILLSTEKKENKHVSVRISSNDANNDGSIDGDEGYNLLGNPYGIDISVDKLMDVLKAANLNINAYVYIWNPNLGSGNGGFDIISNGTIAPFHAFFVRFTQAGISGKIDFNRSTLIASKENSSLEERQQISEYEYKGAKLFLGNGQKFDTYQIQFTKGGEISGDRRDGYKLFSLNPNAIELFSTVGNGVKLAKNTLPPLRSLKGDLHIPLTIEVPQPGHYDFRWSIPENLPAAAKFFLIDHKTNQKINLLSAKNYEFQYSHNNKIAIENPDEKNGPPSIANRTNNSTDNTRFELFITMSSTNKTLINNAETIAKTKLLSLFPNPFTSQVSVKMQIRKTNKVIITIYNIIGQKIASWDEGPHKGIYTTPPYQMPSDAPSGVYICWVKIGDKVFTKKMTYIK